MTLAPGDIEAAAISHLAALLDPAVEVGTRVPNPRPDAFIRLGLIGGEARNIAVEHARLLVECWAYDSLDAFALARRAWAAIADAECAYLGDLWVCAVEMGRPVSHPDAATPQPRYQFTADLWVAMTEEVGA